MVNLNLNTEIQQLNSQIVALSNKINEKVGRANQLKAIRIRTPQIDAESRMLSTIIGDLNATKTNLEKRMQDLTGLDQFSDNIGDYIKVQKAQRQKLFADLKQKINDKLTQYKNELSNCQNQVTDAKNQVSQCQTNITACEKDKVALEQQNTLLVQTNTNLADQKRIVDEQLNELKQAIPDYKAAIQEERKKIAEEAKLLLDEKNKCNQEKQVLEQEKEELKRQITNLQKEKELLDNQIQECFASRLNALNITPTRYNETVSQNQTLLQERDQLIAELQKQKDDCETQRATCKSTLNEIERLLQQNQNLVTECEKSKMEINNLNKQLQDEKETIEKLNNFQTTKLNETETKYRKLTQDYDAKLNECEIFKVQINNFKKQLQDERTHCQKQKDECEKIKNEYTQKLTECVTQRDDVIKIMVSWYNDNKKEDQPEISPTTFSEKDMGVTDAFNFIKSLIDTRLEEERKSKNDIIQKDNAIKDQYLNNIFQLYWLFFSTIERNQYNNQNLDLKTWDEVKKAELKQDEKDKPLAFLDRINRMFNEIYVKTKENVDQIKQLNQAHVQELYDLKYKIVQLFLELKYFVNQGKVFTDVQKNNINEMWKLVYPASTLFQENIQITDQVNQYYIELLGLTGNQVTGEVKLTDGIDKIRNLIGELVTKFNEITQTNDQTFNQKVSEMNAQIQSLITQTDQITVAAAQNQNRIKLMDDEGVKLQNKIKEIEEVNDDYEQFINQLEGLVPQCQSKDGLIQCIGNVIQNCDDAYKTFNQITTSVNNINELLHESDRAPINDTVLQKLNRLSISIKDAQNTIVNKNIEIQNKQTAINNLNEQLKTTSLSDTECQTKLNKCINDNTQLQKQINDLNGQIIQKTNEHNTILKSAEQLRVDLLDKEKEIKDLTKDINEKATLVTSLTKTLNVTRDSNKENLKAIENLKQQLQKQKGEFESQQNAASECQANLIMMESEKNKLQQQLKDKEQEYESLKTNGIDFVNQKNTTIQDLKQKEIEIQRLLEESKTTISNKDIAIDKLNRDIEKLEDELIALKVNNTDNEVKINQLEKEKEECKQKLNQIEQEKINLIQGLTNIENQKNEQTDLYTVEKQTWENTNNQLNDAVNKLTQTIREKENEIFELQANQNRLNEGNQKLTQDLEKEKQDCTQKLNQLNTEKTDLTIQLMNLGGETREIVTGKKRSRPSGLTTQRNLDDRNRTVILNTIFGDRNVARENFEAKNENTSIIDVIDTLSQNTTNPCNNVNMVLNKYKDIKDISHLYPITTRCDQRGYWKDKSNCDKATDILNKCAFSHALGTKYNLKNI